MVLMVLILMLVLVYGVFLYNKMVGLKEAVIASEKEISVQLDRRGKVFDSLISAVKKYMQHEKGTLEEIVRLRSKILETGVSSLDVKDAEQKLSEIVLSGNLTSSLNMTMEAYPDLKANTNMLQLQEEIVSTENKLSFAKKAFNNAIEVFNSTKRSVPEVFIVNMFKNLDGEFSYWELSAQRVVEEEARRVEF